VRRGDLQIVRLWARDQVTAMLDHDPALGAARPSRAEAVALAVKHQIVTPVSGAVVLETQQQYDANGLSPVTAVPLPPALWAALLTLPLVWLACRRHRTRSRTA
jgi:hypothetical protein